MFKNLAREIELVGRGKGIDKKVLVEALESALLSAARKVFGHHLDLEAHFNLDLGEIELFEFKTVVDEVKEPALEITLPEAQKIDPGVAVGDSLGIKMETKELG